MTFTPAGQLTIALVFALALITCLWVVQLVTRDAGIVDVGWSATLGVLAVFYGLTCAERTPRISFVMGLAAIWSFRLAIHLLVDRVLGKPEDGRYQKLRSAYGSSAQLFFFGFFLIQALLAWLFSVTFWVAMRRDGALDGWDLAGILVWCVALVGESLADAQLARFRASPSNKGKTCRAGLWRYSRHPNYFCEWLYWWSFVLIAWPSTWGPVTLLAPALMLFFLFKVTGIPTTEAQALLSRGDDYRDYQRTTSVFFPWFPKQMQ